MGRADRLQGSPEGSVDGDKTTLEEEGFQRQTSCGHAVGDGTIVGLSGGGLHDGSWRVDGCLELAHPIMPSALRVAPLLYHLRSRAEYRPEKAWSAIPGVVCCYL